MNGMNAKKHYIERMEYFRSHPQKCRVLQSINRIATAIVFLAYPALLIWLLLQKNPILAQAIIVPLDAFLILSVFRWIINRKRPYELYETPAAIEKNTKGKSFPSRHVFSVFVIAMTFFFVSPWPAAGVALVVLGVLLGWMRVLLGVHFLSDVLVGAAWGVLAGALGYMLF